MTIIGITGGIGSGKSFVCKILKERYNADIIDTDKIAKEQMQIGSLTYKSVISNFGNEILHENGEIDKDKLSKIVFNNKDKLNLLNKISHPNVILQVKDRINLSKSDIIAIETALAIESGLDHICDQVWFVKASEDIRRKRLIKSRDISHEKINKIFMSQAKDTDYEQKGYTILHNNGDINKLAQNIDKLINIIYKEGI